MKQVISVGETFGNQKPKKSEVERGGLKYKPL
jgi:hypothetical protein